MGRIRFLSINCVHCFVGWNRISLEVRAIDAKRGSRVSEMSIISLVARLRVSLTILLLCRGEARTIDLGLEELSRRGLQGEAVDTR